MKAKILVVWETVMRNKEAVATIGLIKENKKRIDRIYHVGDYVMIKLDRTESKQI